MAITLHDYNPADFETLYAIDRACYPPGIAYTRRALREFLEQPGAESMVARLDETAKAGAATIGGFVIAFAGEATAHIITIDVVAEHRRSGIGTALLRGMEQRLAGRGVRVVELETATTNEAGVAFWQRHGYRSCGVLRDYYHLAGSAKAGRLPGRMDAYLMCKTLDGSGGGTGRNSRPVLPPVK